MNQQATLVPAATVWYQPSHEDRGDKGWAQEIHRAACQPTGQQSCKTTSHTGR